MEMGKTLVIKEDGDVEQSGKGLLRQLSGLL
jgi:hypothetical protein